ncbi:phage tail protein [Ensifer aridi]|uniref:phage tail protein n=1 Tax=Ensifer aridi TaxID=1708715 RepID=UPI001FCDD08E|nr:phage tail protein [Ensifer aridi]
MTTPYVTGTVSVTAGSAVVTGTGTAWQTALIAGGLFGLDSSNGNPVPILSVDSDTQITLAKPWRGTTANGQAYWIIRDTAYLQQLSANAQALATYIQRLDNAVLAALASLTAAADKLPYFNGSGSAALTDFKSAARSLLALTAAADKLPYFNSTDGAALTDFKASARSLLALVAAADKLPYFTGPTGAALADFKAKGRDILNSATTLELLGKFGPVFGGTTPVPSSADVGLSDGDFNTINVPGVYTIAGTWANGPNGNVNYTAILEVKARSFSNLYYQTLYHTGLGTWERFTSASGGLSWPNAWYRVDAPLVGTVSNSGSLTTGAIMERGSNANGEYLKLADGTLICTTTGLSSTCDVAVGNIFRGPDVVWTFPAPSVSTAVVMCQAANFQQWANARLGGTTNATIRKYGSGTDATSQPIYAVSFGRWF